MIYVSSYPLYAQLAVNDPILQQQARHTLFSYHQDLAQAMARKHARHTPAHKVPSEDLQSAAYEGLLHALDHFDPAHRGEENTLDQSFRRYASRCIYGFLMAEMIAQDPLNRRLLDQVRQYRREYDQRAQEHGRAPTSEELRQALGLRDESRFQLLEAWADYQVNQESLAPEPRPGEIDEDLEDWTLTQAAAYSSGRSPNASNPPYEATVRTLFREQLQSAVQQLPVLEQQIVRVHYFGEETLTQIAREVGLSRQTVSQRHQRALAQLGQTLRERGYGEESLPEEWAREGF